MLAVSIAFSRVRTTSSWCATSLMVRGRLQASSAQQKEEEEEEEEEEGRHVGVRL